ncbi:MAG: hypothetical protein AAGL99_16955 [Pseudomonadota bacterium]
MTDKTRDELREVISDAMFEARELTSEPSLKEELDLITDAVLALLEPGWRGDANDLELGLKSIYMACKRRYERTGLTENQHLDFVKHTGDRAKRALEKAGRWPGSFAQRSGWLEKIAEIADRANVNSYELDDDDVASLLTGIRLDLNYLLWQNEKAAPDTKSGERDD